MADRIQEGPGRRAPEDCTQVDPGRRRLIAVAGLAGAGAVAATAASMARAEVAESAEEQIKGRYERTPHVERFYFLNRL